MDTSETTICEEESCELEVGIRWGVLQTVTDMSEFRHISWCKHQRHYAHSISWLLKMSSAVSQL